MHPNRLRPETRFRSVSLSLRGHLHRLHLNIDHINGRFWLIIRIIALLAMIILLSVFAAPLHGI